MNWTMLGSRWLNTKARRLVFVITLIPFCGLIATLTAAAYFSYQVYSDQRAHYGCFLNAAEQKLGLTDADIARLGLPALESVAAQVPAAQLARRWMDDRRSPDASEVEHGDAYRRCLIDSYIGGSLLNAESMLFEARNFAFWTVLPTILFVLFAAGRSVVRWVNAA